MASGVVVFRIREDYHWAYIDLLAAVVGAVGGLGAVAFRDMIFLVERLFFGEILAAAPSPYFVVILPIIGGLIVGPVVYKLAPEARGDAIPQIMEAVQRGGGEIRKRVGLLVILAAAITTGSGGSAGREGPIAQIGASFGSAVGHAFHLGVVDMRVLTTCGVAAGLAGIFNAPMGGAVFAMEVISRKFSASEAVPVLLSAVVGNAVASAFVQPVPDFILPHFNFSTNDLALCFILGPIFGLLAGLWVLSYFKVEDFFSAIPIPGYLKPALGALPAGLSGLYFLNYGIMGVGYDGINRVFSMVTSDSSSDILMLLIILGLAKVIVTASTVGSGGAGGLFAPTLYIGSMFGAVFGILALDRIPGLLADPGAYGLLGMGAFFAGAARAPLTCIIMIPEMAGSYNRIPPLIISCILSAAVAQLVLRSSSMYTIKLQRKGIFLDVPEPVLGSISIGEAMHRSVVTVSPDLTIAEVRERLFAHNFSGFPVVEGDRLVGVITFDDVRKVPLEFQGTTLVKDIALKEVVKAFPDQSMKTAMDIMYKNNIGRLPIVKKDDPDFLLGIVTRTDVIQAYEGRAKVGSEVEGIAGIGMTKVR